MFKKILSDIVNKHLSVRQRITQCASRCYCKVCDLRDRPDHQNCDFGRWWATLSEDIKASPIADSVYVLHELLHKEEDKLLYQLHDGDKAAIPSMLQPESDYSKTAKMFVRKCLEWMNKT